MAGLTSGVGVGADVDVEHVELNIVANSNDVSIMTPNRSLKELVHKLNHLDLIALSSFSLNSNPQQSGSKESTVQ
jgi:hypothetical protein